MSRTLEDIDKILTLAKINPTDILPVSQTIYFNNNQSNSNNYILLELKPQLMKTFQAGESIFINGEHNENIVMCTNDTTFEVVNTETSNSLLLIENLQLHDDIKDTTERTASSIKVEGVFFDYLEVVQKKPKLEKLQGLLEKTKYKGPEHEFNVNSNDLFTFEEMWSKVQASKKELQEALNSLNVITIDNKLRLLDFEYHFRVLSFMLKLIEENSWSLNEIDFDETVRSLSDLISPDVINCMFDIYAEETVIVDGVQLYKYNDTKVCQFFARVLLHSAGKFNLNEFLQAWQESVPEGMFTDEEMLYGVAIIDRKAVPSVIWAFSESKLPENINERFKALFMAKDKWAVPEIAPYIQRLTTDKLDVNALLAKHARASKVDGVKHYSSKHAK